MKISQFPIFIQLMRSAELLRTGKEQSGYAIYPSVTGSILRKVSPAVNEAGHGWLGMTEQF